MLVVDDEEDILNSMALLLQDGASLHVHTARDGLEALDVLERESVDLLLTDYKMPRMNGLVLLRKVAERYPGMPSLLVTAYPDPQIREEAGRLPGFSGFITKPFDPAELLAHVSAALARATA